MMAWEIKHIFDGDYGCEELQPGEKAKVSVTLVNEKGETKVLSVEDQWLLDKNCVLSIENPQNRKENSPLSDREIPIIRKKHVESFRFFPYLVGKKAAFTAFCPIG